MKQHYQFIIDGTVYQLDSNCRREIWPSLCDRVGKNLERISKEVAKDIVFEATVVGSTNLCHDKVDFRLTINPQGIKL